MITNELKSAVETKVLEVYLKAQEVFGKMFDLCKIEYKDMGSTAGKAHYYENRITLSPTLLQENGEEFINRTVGHEIAHIITFKLYGQIITPHGKHWKSVMVKLGMNPTRCHTYNVDSVKRNRRNVKRIHYVCNCQSHMITIMMHGRIKYGAKVTCRRCHTPIRLNTFVENIA